MKTLSSKYGWYPMCVIIAMLLLGSAMASAPVAADADLALCASPQGDEAKAMCAAYTQAILDTTVLLRMVSQCTGRPEGMEWWFDSHATILDSRTVLTHNHYRILGDERCVLKTLRLYTPEGKIITEIKDAAALKSVTAQLNPKLANCPLETCVLRLDQPYLRPSSALQVMTLEQEGAAERVAGMAEIAEINWKGYPGSTYVQWTRPVRLARRGNVRVLELSTCIKQGASGGGAYIRTPNALILVGNGWLTKVDVEGSVVALNPTEVHPGVQE